MLLNNSLTISEFFYSFAIVTLKDQKDFNTQPATKIFKYFFVSYFFLFSVSDGYSRANKIGLASPVWQLFVWRAFDYDIAKGNTKSNGRYSRYCERENIV